VDDDPVGKLRDPVMVSALTQDQTDLAGRAANLSAGRMFVYHCSEGRPGTIVTREFDDLGATGCLQKGLAAVHCSALDESHFAKWRKASGSGQTPAGAVVWSPFSNLWLYGITTQVDKARRNRLAVCLGTDWGPSGTKNLLGEIKVARIWSDRQGWGLTDHDLVRMVTASPGDALAQSWGQPVGRLVKGGLGDALVLANRDPDPWSNLVTAREAEVLLVVVGGREVYGRADLMQTAGARSTTSVPIGRYTRRVSLIKPNDRDKPWTWREVIDGMDAVRAKAAVTPPVGSSGFRRKAIGRYAVIGDPPGTPPFVARPDMPGLPSQLAGPPPPGRKLKIPEIQTVYHDRAWLECIKGQGFHGGVLDALADFY
jgi:5-methylthioadenosine/S-adenosylhomocysteine deaminase